MKHSNIASKVKQVIDDYERPKIENKRDGKAKNYSQEQTIERINAYINDQYTERNEDAIFWNISNYRITHFAKLLGVDTKDFLPYGIGEYNMIQSWGLRKFVKKWFREEQFYKTLNDVSEGEATYGSQVWKKTYLKDKTKLEESRLENLRFDQYAKTIRKTDVVELHELTRRELYEKKDVWDNVQELLDENKEKYEIWEFNGYWEEDGKPKLKKYYGSGFGDKYRELWKEDIDESPYYDFHLGRYRGRWLRVGVVERLFKLQERANQLVNQNAQVTEIASLLLFKTAQSGDSLGNILTQAENGQIIGSDDLEQIGISNTGLNLFIQEMQMIENQADTLCLTPRIIQGESSPSNTTFRGMAVMSSSAKSAFTAYHQDLGEGIAEILLKDIFPREADRWAKEPFIEIAEDDSDIEMYDKAMLEYLKKQWLLDGKGPVTEGVIQLLQEDLAEKLEKVGRKVIMDKNWINFKWGIKMMPTNESVDKSTMNDAYFNSLNMVGANPMLTNIPLFKQYLEDNGITWSKLTPRELADLAQQAGSKNLPEQKKPDALLAQAEAK